MGMQSHSKKENLENGNTGRIVITRKVVRKIFCKICNEQVPSISTLVIHLDREHNIQVKGPPRIVDAVEIENKEELANVSKLLQSIENRPRNTEAISKSSDSNTSSSSSSEDEDDSDDSFENKVRLSEDGLYCKAKEKEIRRITRKDRIWTQKVTEKLHDPKVLKEVNKYVKCQICMVELPQGAAFAHLRDDHMRQHEYKVYHHCPFCSMAFMFEHQLNMHLEDIRVPVVPSDFPDLERNDMLYKLHHCPVKDCSAAFISRKCLLFHRTYQHDGLHRCSSCEKPFIHYAVLRRHIQHAHNWEKRLLYCPVQGCDKSFLKKKPFTTHLSHSHTQNEKEEGLRLMNSEGFRPSTQKPERTMRRTFWSCRPKLAKPRATFTPGYVSESGSNASKATTSTASSSPAIFVPQIRNSLTNTNPIRLLRWTKNRTIIKTNISSSLKKTKIAPKNKHHITVTSTQLYAFITKCKLPSGRFRCPVCPNLTFSKKYSVHRHCRSTHSTKFGFDAARFKCTLCRLSFSSPSNVLRHMRNVHRDQQETSTLPLSSSAKSNENGHQLKMKTAWSLAQENFQQRANRGKNVAAPKKYANSSSDSEDESQHLFAPPPKKPRISTCSQCSKQFNSPKSLQVHKAWHIRKNNKIPAEIESKRLELDEEEELEEINPANAERSDSDDEFENLFEPVVKKSEISTCQECYKEFKTLKSLQAHKGWHSRKKDKAPQEIESKRLKLNEDEEDSDEGLLEEMDPANAEEHERPATKSQILSCPQCSKEFKTPKSLQTHKGWHSRGKDKVPQKVVSKRLELDEDEEHSYEGLKEMDPGNVTAMELNEHELSIKDFEEMEYPNTILESPKVLREIQSNQDFSPETPCSTFAVAVNNLFM